MSTNTVQRGSGWSIKLVYNLYKLFGYKFVYYLMYPVTFFYFIFASNVKIALRDYYHHIGKSFNAIVYFHHLRHFAICMCDRFISKVDSDKYTFELVNYDEFYSALDDGGIIAMSHIGGWATAGNSFRDYPMNIVMQEVMLEEIKQIEDSIEKTVSNIKIIDLSKDPIKATIDIANALIDNELVAMMVDRVTVPKHSKSLLFFNKEAYFNKNPFEIAYKTQKSIIALFVVYQKPQVYKIEFIRINMDKSQEQDGEINNAMQVYIKKLEEIVSKNPEQWFNFYNFWEEGK